MSGARSCWVSQRVLPSTTSKARSCAPDKGEMRALRAVLACCSGPRATRPCLSSIFVHCRRTWGALDWGKADEQHANKHSSKNAVKRPVGAAPACARCALRPLHRARPRGDLSLSLSLSLSLCGRC